MPVPCAISGCKAAVPAELQPARLCLPHFLAAVDQACSDMRHETVLGQASADRREKIIQYIAANGELLARVSTGGARLPDELKARVLNTFLSLMNLRENLDRADRRATTTEVGG